MGCAQIRFYDAAAAAALALALFLVSGAAANETPQACSSKPLVVKIHAAWCATCKSLDATWEQIRSDLGDQATVVELDVTDRPAYQQSQAEAERLGISDFFRKYRSKIGAPLTLSVLGLFGELAGFVLVEQRGPMLLIVGIALVYFGLVVLEVAPHLFRGSGVTGGSRLGPVGAGAAFSLVTTPCASPLLAAVLAAAAAQSVPGLSVATMACFSLGYTLLVFLAGVFGGKLVGFSRRIPLAAPRAAAAALLVVSGLAFAATGATWF